MTLQLKEYNRLKKRESRAKRKEKGLCTECGQPNDRVGVSLCSSCAANEEKDTPKPISPVENLPEEDKLEKIVKRLYALKTRAKKQGLPFTIQAKDLLPLPDKCPILGINLSYVQDRSDETFSIVMKDPLKGYTRGNTRIISLKASRIKGQTTIQELQHLLDWMRG